MWKSETGLASGAAVAPGVGEGAAVAKGEVAAAVATSVVPGVGLGFADGVGLGGSAAAGDSVAPEVGAVAATWVDGASDADVVPVPDDIRKAGVFAHVSLKVPVRVRVK